MCDAGRRSRHTNAYFTGFGATQRIVLYDTLLQEHTPDEVESVLAHEIGHWRHGHIMQGIARGRPAPCSAFWVLSKVLAWAAAQPSPVLNGPTDPARLPADCPAGDSGRLDCGAGGERHQPAHGGQADEASLELAGMPRVFMETERKMAVDNISNVTPNPVSVLFFASHPPVVERIEMGEARPPAGPSVPGPRGGEAFTSGDSSLAAAGPISTNAAHRGGETCGRRRRRGRARASRAAVRGPEPTARRSGRRSRAARCPNPAPAPASAA